ncbi:hypothetical protein QVD17_17183 [Tagetes erecta]|uniref:Uncharacterized protein n=1 Tax=Tagetes erecta TaxID=13708 RepID=A0AAD8KZ02_TARER|nr:hypothetical protein QVD17_17183 [Tagetes erecta]
MSTCCSIGYENVHPARNHLPERTHRAHHLGSWGQKGIYRHISGASKTLITLGALLMLLTQPKCDIIMATKNGNNFEEPTFLHAMQVQRIFSQSLRTDFFQERENDSVSGTIGSIITGKCLQSADYIYRSAEINCDDGRRQ